MATSRPNSSPPHRRTAIGQAPLCCEARAGEALKAWPADCPAHGPAPECGGAASLGASLLLALAALAALAAM